MTPRPSVGEQFLPRADVSELVAQAVELVDIFHRLDAGEDRRVGADMGHPAKVRTIWLGTLSIFETCALCCKLAGRRQAAATSARDQSKWQAAR